MRTGTLELNAFDRIWSSRQILEDSFAGDRDDEILIDIEQDLSGQLIYYEMYLYDDADRPLRDDIWRLAQLHDYGFFNRIEARNRLETVYTRDTLTALEPYLVRYRQKVSRKVWDQYIHTFKIRSYLILCLSLLAMSIGLSFVSVEAARRHTPPPKPLQG